MQGDDDTNEDEPVRVDNDLFDFSADVVASRTWTTCCRMVCRRRCCCCGGRMWSEEDTEESKRSTNSANRPFRT